MKTQFQLKTFYFFYWKIWSLLIKLKMWENKIFNFALNNMNIFLNIHIINAKYAWSNFIVITFFLIFQLFNYYLIL